MRLAAAAKFSGNDSKSEAVLEVHQIMTSREFHFNPSSDLWDILLTVKTNQRSHTQPDTERWVKTSTALSFWNWVYGFRGGWMCVRTETVNELETETWPASDHLLPSGIIYKHTNQWQLSWWQMKRARGETLTPQASGPRVLSSCLQSIHLWTRSKTGEQRRTEGSEMNRTTPRLCSSVSGLSKLSRDHLELG